MPQKRFGMHRPQTTYTVYGLDVSVLRHAFVYCLLLIKFSAEGEIKFNSLLCGARLFIFALLQSLKSVME